MKTTARRLLVVLLCGLGISSLPQRMAGQAKKQPKKAEPRALLALPLGVKPGATTRVTMRGLKLDTANEIRFADPKVTARILSKGKSAPPEKLPPDRFGDTQLVAEVTVPAGVSGPLLPFVVKTAAGEAKSHALLLEAAMPVLTEKEPNDGFPNAQNISLPAAVDGVIDRPRDVDVFAFEGKAGQRVTFEVLAARHGSALDSILTLYGPGGSEVAGNDDSGGSLDSRLEATLPRDGTYYLSLIDAHDHGSPLHVYRLVGRVVK